MMAYAADFLTFISGGIVGWIYAHYSILNECRKLGGFYVGSTVVKVGEIR